MEGRAAGYNFERRHPRTILAKFGSVVSDKKIFK